MKYENFISYPNYQFRYSLFKLQLKLEETIITLEPFQDPETGRPRDPEDEQVINLTM